MSDDRRGDDPPAGSERRGRVGLRSVLRRSRCAGCADGVHSWPGKQRRTPGAIPLTRLEQQLRYHGTGTAGWTGATGTRTRGGPFSPVARTPGVDDCRRAQQRRHRRARVEQVAAAAKHRHAWHSPPRRAPGGSRAGRAWASTSRLFGSVNFLVSILSGAPNEFSWMWPFVAAHMVAWPRLPPRASPNSQRLWASPRACQYSVRCQARSDFIRQLNGPPNLAREASAVAQRVGLVFVARDYWRAGIAVAVRPEYQDSVAQTTQIAIVIFDAAAAYLRQLPTMEQYGADVAQCFPGRRCEAAATRPCPGAGRSPTTPAVRYHTTAWSSTHRAVLPGRHKPGVHGPAHVREIASSPDILRDVFTNVLRVQLRTGGSSSTPTAPSGPGSWSLVPGQRLLPDCELASPSGTYVLRYQSDGNLVIYQRGGGPVWAASTEGQPAGHVEMQGDGNLVMYNAFGQPVWASDTWGFPGAYASILDDGHLVIVDGSGVPIWWSGGE